MKVLARELNVPVLAAAQLSRAIEQRADKEPQLSDLRESGSLEQDADIVMFIHRPELYEKDTLKQNVAQIKVAKHRNGPVGTIELVFRSQIAKFENAATYQVNLSKSCKMAQFKGFPEGKIHQVSIPAPFFREILPGIDDLNELKLSIYFFWRLDRMEGVFRYISRSEIIKDELFMKGLYSASADPSVTLDQALSRAVQRGTILHAKAAQKEIIRRHLFFKLSKRSSSITGNQER